MPWCFFVPFFVYEAAVKYKVPFTFWHHTLLAIAIGLLLYFDYFIGIIPILFLYELPGVFDVILRNFIPSSKIHLKILLYKTAYITRMVTTSLIGPTVLLSLLIYIDFEFNFPKSLNIIIAMLSIMLNLMYTMKSLKIYTKKQQQLLSVSG